MAAADDILKTRYSLFYESLLNIAANVPRRRAVKRQIAALGANDYFIARETLLPSQHA